jgi:predicted nucleic acid-binding protein
MILADTNVLIDLVQGDFQWADWSEHQLLAAQQRGPVFINAVGYAELMPAFDSMALLDHFLKHAKINLKNISRTTAYLAGEVFALYRTRKGTKTGVLADFFIGAQAQTEGLELLTRDVGRYKTYFPQVRLIHP